MVVYVLCGPQKTLWRGPERSSNSIQRGQVGPFPPGSGPAVSEICRSQICRMIVPPVLSLQTVHTYLEVCPCEPGALKCFNINGLI